MSRRLLTVAALAAALTISACGSDSPTTSEGSQPGTTKVSLMLNWVPYGEHAPFYYGIKKGYYQAEGLELEIKPGTGSGTTIQQVAQNQVTFGWADTPPLLKGINTGMKVKSLGVFLQKGPSSIESLADKNISKPADLKGKTVGGTPGDALYAVFPAWLKANNLSSGDVTVVNVDAAGKIAALSEGKVDAIMGFFHDQGPTVEARTKKKVNALLYADSGLNMLGTGIVVNEQTLGADKEVAAKFVRATQKSWAEAAKDIPGAVAAMAELADNEPPTEVLTKQLTLCLPLLETGGGAAPGVNSEDKWAQTIDLMAKYGDLKDAKSPSAYWDGSHAKG
jgi:ABC-type nitrate/sulfonate/bicarbonate transport system substrate-binding protein